MKKYKNSWEFDTKCGTRFRVVVRNDVEILYQWTLAFCIRDEIGEMPPIEYRMKFLEDVGITKETMYISEEIKNNIKLWILLNGYELSN